MTEKEKQIQKALGTFPTFTCDQCHKEFFTDEKYMWVSPKSTAHKHLCIMCATALYVCNLLLKKDMGEFTKK